MPTKANNTVRIIAGKYRRRLLRFSEQNGLRPTPERVRETLFNWLGQELDGISCLDLFAGSGALGFEAASRGASRVVLVERNSQAVQNLRTNRQMLAASEVDIELADAIRYIQNTAERFDLIFLDPPFELDLLPQLLPVVGSILKKDGLVYIESRRQPKELEGWSMLKQTKAGIVFSALLAQVNV